VEQYREGLRRLVLQGGGGGGGGGAEPGEDETKVRQEVGVQVSANF